MWGGAGVVQTGVRRSAVIEVEESAALAPPHLWNLEKVVNGGFSPESVDSLSAYLCLCAHARYRP